MGNRRDFLIKRIVEICGKLDDKGFGANHDGNVSVCFEDGLLSTPTAVSKGEVVPEMILTLDMAGKKIDGIGKPFSEIKLHLAAYNCRPDVKAVVHAHPPFAMARGMLGQAFEINVPEAIVSIGDVIPVAPYAMPGAPENNGIIANALARCDVFMMAGNGVLSVGRDLPEAYLRLELLEHLLKIDHYAQTSNMGTPFQLPPQDKQKLLEKRASIGLGPKGLSPTPTQPSTVESDTLKKIIAEELKKVLK